MGFFASLLFLFGLIGYNNYGKSCKKDILFIFFVPLTHFFSQVISALIWGIMTNSLKKAFCRGLLLAVALGYLVITLVFFGISIGAD